MISVLNFISGAATAMAITQDPRWAVAVLLATAANLFIVYIAEERH